MNNTITWESIKKNWELKPRVYRLLKGEAPPLRQIRSKHTYKNHLMFFDNDKKENRELRYIAGAKSPFMDEQPSENVRVQQIFFTDGLLSTSEQDIALQQFLAITPDNGVIFEEIKPEQTAEEEVVNFEAKAEAYTIISALDSDKIAAFMYSQIGEEAFSTSTKELKRDLYVIADTHPSLIVSLEKSDITMLKYTARKAVKFGVLDVDGKTVKWGKNKRKVMVVPVDETPYTALANFFLTDDGHEVKAKVLELLEKY